MAITISSSKLGHRYDNTAGKPVFTFGGVDANLHRLMIPDQLYQPIVSPYTWSPLNRTQMVPVTGRNLTKSTATMTGIVRDAAYPNSNYFYKSPSATGVDGATFPTQTAGSPVSIEGYTRIGITATVAIMLGQSTYNPSVSYHAMRFNSDLSLEIVEAGSVKRILNYDLGDGGLIEHKNGIVKYYLIKADKTLKLLRVARPLFTTITPAVMLYNSNAVLDDAIIWLGDEASSNVQVYGVIDSYLQDWGNQGTWVSTGDVTTNKDKKFDVTYFSEEKQLLEINIQLDWRFKEDYQAFLEFFRFHDKAIPWIFVDSARSQIFSLPNHGLKANEMFCRFISNYQDSPLGVEMFGVKVDIRQETDPPELYTYI